MPLSSNKTAELYIFLKYPTKFMIELTSNNVQVPQASGKPNISLQWESNIFNKPFGHTNTATLYYMQLLTKMNYNHSVLSCP